MRYFFIFLFFIVQSQLFSLNNSVLTNVSTQKKIKAVNPEYVIIDKDLLNKLQYRYKDPFIAGLLSVPMWGIGQFYAGEYTKGSFFVFGDLVYKAMLLGLIIKLNNNYTSKVSGDSEVDWGELSSNDKVLVIGYVVSYLAVSAWSVADAVCSASKFNKNNSLKSKFKLTLVPDDENSFGVRVGIDLRF